MDNEEKVARAICHQEGHDPDKFDILNPDDRSNYPNIPNWMYWKAHARAAIMAIVGE